MGMDKASILPGVAIDLRNKMGKKISIVTICHSNPDELAFTSRSISADKLRFASALEWIVVDGSSDDACQSVLQQHGHADYVIHESDFGIYDAMNKGLSRVTGKTVVMLNSGDRLLPGVVERILEFGEDELAGSIIYGDAIYKLGERKFLAKAAVPVRNGRVFDHLPIHQCAFIPSSFYRTNLYDTRYRISGDTELMSRAFASLTAKYVPIAISMFEFGGVSNNPGNLLAALTHWLEYSRLRGLSGMRLLLATKIYLGRFMKIRLLGFERYYLNEFNKIGHREFHDS